LLLSRPVENNLTAGESCRLRRDQRRLQNAAAPLAPGTHLWLVSARQTVKNQLVEPQQSHSADLKTKVRRPFPQNPPTGSGTYQDPRRTEFKPLSLKIQSLKIQSLKIQSLKT
jgi:hypothetical protein